jgi:hypothetical protein
MQIRLLIGSLFAARVSGRMETEGFRIRFFWGFFCRLWPRVSGRVLTLRALLVKCIHRLVGWRADASVFD